MSKTISHGLIFLLALTAVLFLDNFDLGITLHMLVYLSVASVFLNSLLRPSIRSTRKALAMLCYYSLLLYQVSFLMLHDFDRSARLTVAGLLFFTFFIEQLFLHRAEKYCVSDTVDENSLSFEELRYLKRRVAHQAKHIKKLGGVVTLTFIRDIIKDLPRNCAIHYVNKESLSDEYFKNLDASLNDPYVYLVFSDTGSAASNFIGLFTNKPYNHISISFDCQLKTLISYNGGERVSPPGMNPEMVEYFYQKEDASIRVYRLKVTSAQKSEMAEKIRCINREGSAYNMVGACLGRTFQPNIMVCSEFVYSLLESVGAEYFSKTAFDVKPADLIELDYERKLEFVERIELNSFCDELVTQGKPPSKVGRPVELHMNDNFSES